MLRPVESGWEEDPGDALSTTLIWALPLDVFVGITNARETAAPVPLAGLVLKVIPPDDHALLSTLTVTGAAAAGTWNFLYSCVPSFASAATM